MRISDWEFGRVLFRSAWREVLPAQSLCLAVPIVPPSHWDRIDAREQEAEAADRLRHEPPEQSMQENGRKRSEEHTSELQSLMRISYAVFCLTQKTNIEHKEGLMPYDAQH